MSMRADRLSSPSRELVWIEGGRCGNPPGMQVNPEQSLTAGPIADERSRSGAPLVRLLGRGGLGLVSMLLLALAIQGPWNTSMLAGALFAVEASEGEEAATRTATERIQSPRKQEHDPSPPVWASPRLDETESFGVAQHSAPVFVDSRSGKQRVYLLRHLLI